MLRYSPRNSPSRNVQGGHSVSTHLRFYAAIVLIAVVITALLLSTFVRKLSIEGYVDLAQLNNLSLMQAALRHVMPELRQYVVLTRESKPGDEITHQMPAALSSSIAELMQTKSVAKFKIYNSAGTVVYATDPAQVGQSHEYNGGFESAINGKVQSRLIYRDTFNLFDAKDPDANLMSTYAPINGQPGEPIAGVLEIYTDANSLVHRIESTQLQILVGVVLILATLYLALIMMARRASDGFERQQRAALNRAEVLEMLFADNLISEERDKKETAAELHEGLAQTLCAIKVSLEQRRERHSNADALSGEDAASPIVLLQDAIQQARDIAIGLRPSSLDELGLLRTVGWYCEHFEYRNTEIRVDLNASLSEGDIPAPLKIVIFRVIELALKNIAEMNRTDLVQITLRLANDLIALEIKETAREPVYVLPTENLESYLNVRFAGIAERTTLTGGYFSVESNAEGSITLRASWPGLNK